MYDALCTLDNISCMMILSCVNILIMMYADDDEDGG